MKTETAKRTPTPLTWRAGGKAAMYQGRFTVYRNYNERTNLSEGFELVALFENQGDMERAVRAVNAHEELLAAAKYALATLKNNGFSGSDVLEAAIAKADR